MKRLRRFLIIALSVFVPFLVCACSLDKISINSLFGPKPTEPPKLTAAEIYESYEALEDQLVEIEGSGVIMAMMPLCEGYTGMDMRPAFVDTQGSSITAWGWPEGAESQSLRTFRAYVRVFRGEIGCPGSLQNQVIPYLEIVEIR